MSFFILYFLIDFGWRSTDAIREWRIRSTGRSQLSGVESTFGKLGLDYPKDPRNSNIYFWFLKNEMALDNPLDDKIFQADRVVVSMKRFDEWYKNFHRSQNWRFIMVDIGIPFLVAMGTLPLLVMK